MNFYTKETNDIATHVTAMLQGQMITIEDSGPGIPIDELPFIFERFYLVEKSCSRQHGGRGLGLSIVQKLVELQGGLK